MKHTSLSDVELVSQIASLCLAGKRLHARVIVHLIEVEDRALDKRSACSSMWAFCIERLGMSEGETRGRLTAAKLVRRFPSVLGRLERGDVHLSALRQLAPYLNEENVDVVRRAKASRPRTGVRPSKPGHIAASTRREVFARDGDQCTHLDSEGRRCECRTRLELDHIHPRALGGGDDASNL
jgi:hypothetical protein